MIFIYVINLIQMHQVIQIFHIAINIHFMHIIQMKQTHF